MTAHQKPPATTWRKGQSGNPKGRPPGIPQPHTRMLQALDVPALLAQLQQQALNGDVQAARTLLERALPVRKATAEPVTLPGIAEAGTLTEKAERIVALVADGHLPPDVGASLIESIGKLARVAETDELARRITALEERHGNPD